MAIYDAFGNLTSSSESLANGWSNPYRCVGGLGVQYDPETNLYWMRVRAYDPTLGRFISHDPLGRLAAMGLDSKPYVYAGNNPVNRTDPSGMLPCCTGPDGHPPSWWADHSGAPDIDGCTGYNTCGWAAHTINCAEGSHEDIEYNLGKWGQPKDLCQPYWDWENGAKQYRDSTLDGMKWSGVGLLIGGALTVIGVAAAQWSSGSFKGELDAADLLMAAVQGMVGGLEAIFPQFASIFGTITGMLQLFQSAVDIAESLASNWWTSAAGDIAMFAAGGPFHLLATALLKFLAGFAIDGTMHQGLKWGPGAMAAGTTLLAVWGDETQRLDSEDIVGWCDHNGGCGTAPQNIFTF